MYIMYAGTYTWGGDCMWSRPRPSRFIIPRWVKQDLDPPVERFASLPHYTLQPYLLQYSQLDCHCRSSADTPLLSSPKDRGSTIPPPCSSLLPRLANPSMSGCKPTKPCQPSSGALLRSNIDIVRHCPRHRLPSLALLALNTRDCPSYTVTSRPGCASFLLPLPSQTTTKISHWRSRERDRPYLKSGSTTVLLSLTTISIFSLVLLKVKNSTVNILPVLHLLIICSFYKRAFLSKPKYSLDLKNQAADENNLQEQGSCLLIRVAFRGL
jgi:hypothetical protein